MLSISSSKKEALLITLLINRESIVGFLFVFCFEPIFLRPLSQLLTKTTANIRLSGKLLQSYSQKKAPLLLSRSFLINKDQIEFRGQQRGSRPFTGILKIIDFPYCFFRNRGVNYAMIISKNGK